MVFVCVIICLYRWIIRLILYLKLVNKRKKFKINLNDNWEEKVILYIKNLEMIF